MQDRDDFHPQSGGWERGCQKKVGESLRNWVYKNLAAVPSDLLPDNGNFRDQFELGFSLGNELSQEALFHTLIGVVQGLILADEPDMRQQELAVDAMQNPFAAAELPQPARRVERVSYNDLEEMQPLVDLCSAMLESASNLIRQARSIFSS